LSADREVTMASAEDDRVRLLRSVDILAQASPADVEAVARIAKDRRYADGELIFKFGAPGDSVLVVVEGTVHATRAGAEITRIASGETFGVSSFLDQGPRTVDARAVGAVRILELERADLMAVADAHPGVMKGLFSVTTRHLRSVLDVAASRRAQGN
jgi:CRP-like cAMP-binding protein